MISISHNSILIEATVPCVWTTQYKVQCAKKTKAPALGVLNLWSMSRTIDLVTVQKAPNKP
jgi:hypothetical protein